MNSAEILHWARQELLFNGSLSESDLKKLCRGSMMNIWKFLMRHVRSEKSVREIRANIFLNGKTAQSAGISPTEHVELAAKRNAILSKATEAKQNYQRLRVEVEQLKSDINTIGIEEEKIKKAIHDSEVRATLLDTFASRIMATGRILEEYERRLLIICTNAEKAKERHIHSGNAAYFASLRAMELDTPLDPTLSPSLVRDVSRMANELNRELSIQCKGDCEMKVSHEKRREIWSHLQLFNYHPSDFIGSLISITHQDRLELKKLFNEVDLLRDAKFHIMSTPGTNHPKSLVELLQAQQRLHSKVHIETEIFLNKTHEKEDALLNLMNIVSRDSTRKMEGEASDKNVLVQWLLDSELLLETEETCLVLIEKNLTEFREELRESSMALEKLKEKQRQIRGNNAKEKTLDSIISRLLRRSAAIKRQHGVLIDEISGFNRSHILPFEDSLISECKGLGEIISAELGAFRKLNLDQTLLILNNVGSHVSISDLSIHRVLHPSMVSVLGSIWYCCNVPVGASADTLIPHILQIRQNMRQRDTRANQMIKARNMALSGPFVKRYGTQEHMNMLLDKASQCERVERVDLVGLLDRAKSRLVAALDYSNGVEVASNDWWSQSGQYTLPDLVVDGKTLLQWIGLFRSLAVQLEK